MEVKKLSLKEIGYKKIILLFLAGVLLIFLSVKDDVISDTDENSDNAVTKRSITYDNIADVNLYTHDYAQFIYETEYYENKLKELILDIKGVSDAAVMVTLEQSSEKIVLKDIPGSVDTVNEADSSGGTRASTVHRTDEDTVLVSDNQSDSIPYILKQINARISGVLILIKTDENIDKYQISQAIESLFNIQPHKINILEMK